ncbi:MAG: hypothetical protein RMY34_19710 [Aulosira sp. DedQUE10]|nr:hypothetical protein [Aulosira sp. DedQUE10]
MKCFIFSRVLLTFFTLFWISPQLAWAGGDVNTDNQSSTTTTSSTANNSETPSNSISNSETATTSTSTPYVPQQTGIVQFNNSSLSTLTYPNCGGVCAFGIVRLTPSGNGNVNPEAVMGVVMQFDSPENRYAQAQRDLSKAQSDRIVHEDQVSILTKLADAIEHCQDSRAHLLALSAAKSLGMTPEQLLFYAYKQPGTCNSSFGNNSR